MFQMRIQPEGERKNDMGDSVFPETDPISLFFRFAYILSVIHRDEYRVTQGSADLTLVTIRCFIQNYTKVLGVLHHLLAMKPADILWPFLIMVSQPENIFSRSDFFLNQAPPSK